jgi:quercetin dioxygenase-like cupin family protein
MSVALRSSGDVAPAAVPGHSFRILADAASTGGRYSFTEATSPVGAAVPPHAHDGCVECFYVLDGLSRLTVSGVAHEAAPGDFVLVPRGAPHGFEVIGQAEARAAVIFAPAGFEDVFRRMPEIFGTPGEPGPLWQRANAEYDTRLLDPAPDDGPPAVTTPGTTGTPLEIRLCAGPRGATFGLGAAASAMWIAAGAFRVGHGTDEVVASAGQLVTFDTGGPASATGATGLAGRNEALLLTFEEGLT